VTFEEIAEERANRDALPHFRWFSTLCLILTVSTCTPGYHYRTKDELQRIATSINTFFPDTEKLDYNQTKVVDKALLSLGLGNLNANDLSELRSVYSDLYLEVRIGDLITDEISQMIRDKVGHIIHLQNEARTFGLCEVYVIDGFDPMTFKGNLENIYADDSIYIPEFPESYGYRTVEYKATDRFRITLDNQYSFVAGPHYYRGLSWQVGEIMKKDRDAFSLPPGLHEEVIFTIIEDKANPKRQYKVLWVVDDQD